MAIAPVYTTSNKATEFVEFLDYLVKFSKMRTGNDVKKLYSDYFSTYMDDTKVTLARTRDGRSIELEVTPPYLKARNTYAENSIYSNRKAARARLFHLLGKKVNGMPIKDTGKYWPFGWEHGVQTHNFSAYEPLMELYGEPTSPLQFHRRSFSRRSTLLFTCSCPMVLRSMLVILMANTITESFDYFAHYTVSNNRHSYGTRNSIASSPMYTVSHVPHRTRVFTTARTPTTANSCFSLQK